MFGGLAALFVVSGINSGAQITGIVVTVLVAAVTGLVTGKVIALTGRRSAPYVDAEEFDGEPDEEVVLAAPFVKTAELEAD